MEETPVTRRQTKQTTEETIARLLVLGRLNITRMQRQIWEPF
jgi:hypothetical protein